MRNIAIIAHVDHGKTTLVDTMLRQSGTFRDNQVVQERVMDSNDLERERGITILAKCTSVEWKGARFNIVDTPGHADFGGEVERILDMVDGAIVLVDAAEGPLPQTKFVVGKALKIGLRPIVVINKVDRSDARPMEVYNEVFDLFAALDATEEQLDFPVLFASGREGWAVKDLDADERKSIAPLFDLIMEYVPAPKCDPLAPFSFLVSAIENDPFVGRVLTGKVHSGSIKVNSFIKGLGRDGKLLEQSRISKILAFRGVKRTGIEEAKAGDIVAIAGMSKATVADTLCDLSVEKPLKSQPIDPPTLAMTFCVNDSPLSGKEGDKVTSRLIWARLEKEAEGNVALSISQTDRMDAFQVAGRGELQLGILIETMRREGFELSISRPRVLFKYDENGAKLELFGEGLEELIGKKGEMVDSLQYLASLICNRIDRDYYRISLDCCGFRERRKEQLEELAKKICASVKRSGRTSALEPMNPYERRIIHATVSEIEGVTSRSVGEEPYRKVLISSTEKRERRDDRRGGFKGGKRGNQRRGARPAKSFDITTSFEKDYKKPKPEDTLELGSGLYSKIEF